MEAVQQFQQVVNSVRDPFSLFLSPTNPIATLNNMSIKNYFNSIALNNDGCEHMECGEFLSARNCFRDSLQFMTMAIVEAQKEMENQPQPLDDGERLSEFQWSVLPHAPLHQTPDVFIYERAIFIYRDDDDPGPSAFELSDESSMIVFNLGLSFHLLARSTNKAMLANEALGFYKIAEAIRCRRTQSGTPELIDLAISNNIGHALYEQVNYEQACSYFWTLKEGLLYFNQEGLFDFISHHDSDGFVLNASIAKVNLAAAA